MSGIFDKPTIKTATNTQQVINTSTSNKNLIIGKTVSNEDIEKLGENTAKQSIAMSKKILSSVTASDTDQFGEKLNNLIGLSKQLNPATMGKPNLLQRVLNLKGSVTNKIKAQYDTVEQRMNVLTAELDSLAVKRKQRVQDLELMYQENQQAYLNLQQDVKLGNEMLEVLKQEAAQLQQNPSNDPFEAEKLAQVNTKIKNLMKRIDDFERGMQLCVFAAPDIRMQQEHNRSLARSVEDIKVTTIPAWQGVFSRYVLALEAKKGAELVNSVYDATDEAFRMQADQLVENTVNIAKVQQRSVVSVETLQHMQSQLIAAVDQARQIEQEGIKKREDAKPQLQKLTQDLIDRFKQ